ncbi:MAG: lipase/acyltransferase domain-containing protein [Candidatus Paceibacteria bacterium]
MKKLINLATFAFLFFSASFVVAYPQFVRADFVCCYTDQDLSLIIGDVLIEGPVGLFNNFAGEIPPPVVVIGDALSSPSQSLTINLLERPHRDRPLQIVKAFDASVATERGVYLLHRIPNDPTPENGPEGDILIPGSFSLVYAPVPENDGNIDTLESVTITFPDLPAFGDPAALSGQYILSVFQLPETKYVYDSALDDYIEVPYTQADLLSWYEWQFVNYDFYNDDIPEYAYYAPDAEAVFSIDEYIGATTIDQECCSSVLFLPGIQSSRLYLSEDAGGLSANERVWEPDRNSEVLALEMNSVGESVNNIYSEDIIDTITTRILFGYEYQSGDVYKNISNFFDHLVAEESIKEWLPYAYDWRYDVFDIVEQGTRRADGNYEKLTDIVEDLVDVSYSGKVTIVAHSNGGLLAKALMLELEKQGKDSYIDQIIFIGTPHYGTPKAIATILHGYDQEHGYGFVVKGEVAREIINNLPSAYGLLPTEKYIQGDQDPVVSFDSSVSTEVYRNNYGNSINNYNTLQAFLAGDNESFRTINEKLYIPAPGNKSMLDMASQNHFEKLDNWRPPEDVRVSSLIGVGLPTLRGIEYQDVTETICNGIFVTFAFCTLERQPRPFGQFSYYGDGTVMMRGADVDYGDKYYLNLKQISNISEIESFSHANITETAYTQELIQELLLSTSSPETIPYIVTNPISESFGGYTIQKIASPVQINVTDNNGRQTGVTLENGQWVTKSEIPDSYYFEMGGIKYLLVPTGTDFETTLIGDGYGGYSYYISELDDSGREEVVLVVENATTTPVLRATITKEENVLSVLSIDENGDGEIDLIVDVNTGEWLILDKNERAVPIVSSGGGGGYYVKKPTSTAIGVSISSFETALTPDTQEYYNEIYRLLLELIVLLAKFEQLKNLKIL